MTPNHTSRTGMSSLGKLCMAAALMLVLQACTSTMPQPRYPVYMQDKPAEATQTVTQAGDDAPPSTPAVPPVIPQGNQGGIETTELAPPPPPPPPPASGTPPVRGETAPVKDTRAAYVYVLQAKDTLYGVSRRFGVPIKMLYELNGLAANASLRIGQKILLPATAVDKGREDHANGAGMIKLEQALAAKPAAPAATAAPVKPATVKPAVAPPATTTTTTTTSVSKPAVAPPGAKPVVSTTTTTTMTPAVKPAPVKPATQNGFPSSAQLTQMGKGLFVWPVKGRILVPFGQLAPNVRNDGINIAADSGTEVRAASDGTVVYQGDQVRELGNTVYIKHANGWYTGYSHLLSMSVKNNEKVTKGQVIGKVGQSGVIDRPQLHFEVRYTPSTDIARPVDPTLVLP